MKKILYAFSVCLLLVLLVGCDKTVTFDEESYSVYVGESLSPSVQGEGYSLSVANNTLATVENNTVIGLKAGVTVLYANTENQSAKATLYILNKEKESSDLPTVTDASAVYYSVVNYTYAQLEQALIKSTATSPNTDISNAFPTLTGYSIAWYTDEECKNPIGINVTTVAGENRFYGVASELDNRVVLDENNCVIGLTYPNLPHKFLSLPEDYNGTVILGIADRAFFGDTEVEEVFIPSSYVSVGAFAFAGCTSLKKVEFGEESSLRSIGAYAFGPTYEYVKEEKQETQQTFSFDTDTIKDLIASLITDLIEGTEQEEEVAETLNLNTDYCTALTDMVLPNSVESIGVYAFYQCSQWSNGNVPTSLKSIECGSYSHTGLTTVALTNVEQIDAYAFFGCEKLLTVTATEKVASCGGYAFSDTALYELQEKNYEAIYAGTILIGCYKYFGTLKGDGRITLPETLTLIADYAINNQQQSNLTVYFPDKNVLIGQRSFYIIGYEDDTKLFPLYSDRLYLSVPPESLNEYKRNYPRYAEHFCTSYSISVPKTGTNVGLHKLLKLSETEYVYDKFIPYGTQPSVIDLSQLSVGSAIKHINSCAFGNISALKTLRLGRIESIGFWAIANCENLSLIDLTGTQKCVDIEQSSIQFSSLKMKDGAYQCKILVTKALLSQYQNGWANRTTARQALITE